MASLNPSQAASVVTLAATSSSLRFMRNGDSRWGPKRSGYPAARCDRTRASGQQIAKGADEPIEEGRAAQSRQLERERMRASNVGLELHFMERRRQSLHAWERVGSKGNTGF